MSRNQSFAHDPSSVRGVRDMVMSRPLPDVKSVPPNLKAFCHPHMYYIRLLFDVDKSSEPQRRVVIVVNDSIIFCDYKNRSIKRVLPICSIQCIYIQKKDEANNRIVRRAWLKTGDSTNELDVLLQQDEFQGSPANEDINELVHICRVIKSHKYHVSLPVLEENDRVFLSSARLGKGDTLKTLGGITDTKFGPDYAPEEPRSDKLALPPNIDTREWTSAELEMPASFNQSSEQMLLRKQSSGFSTSQAQFSNKLQANQVVSETSELSSCLESEVSSLEDTQMFLARKEERVLEKKKQAEQQQQQQPASPQHQPPPPSAQQQQQPPHPHPHHAYHHPPHYAHPGYHPPAYAPPYPHPHQHQHPHHAPHYHDHSPQQQQQQQQHPSLPHSYQQFRPPPLALGRQQPQQAPQPQHASPAPHHAPPPQQHHHHHHHHHHPHSHHHPSHHHSPPALHPPQQHSPPPHRPSPYSTAAAATGSQAPQRQQTRLPSPQPRLTVTARELEAPAPAPGPAAAATAAAAAAPSVAASSASGWGPPDRLHGTRLFEAMGEEYARLRLQQMLAGEQQGGGGGGAAVAPAASSRASSAGIVEEWQRPSSRSPPRPQQPPPPPPPQRAAPATHKHRQSRRSDSRAREGSPRKSRRGGGSEGEGVGTLADTIFSGPVSVDVELYDRLRPQGTRLPRTRGGGRSDAAEAAAGGSGASGGGGGSRSSGRRAPASSGQGSEKGVGHFRTELRDEFWKHYMHTYDTACARSNVGGGDSARRRGAASPSRRDGSPRQKDAHRRAPGSHML